MSQLSAEAKIVLAYAQSHKSNNSAEFNDDIGLPDHIVLSACRELKKFGYITFFESSDDSVEFVEF